MLPTFIRSALLLHKPLPIVRVSFRTHLQRMLSFCFAGGCLGWSRAERPSVSLLNWGCSVGAVLLRQPADIPWILATNLLNNGVNNAVVVSTGWVERQFMTKTCKKAIISNKKIPHIEKIVEGNIHRFGKNWRRGLWWSHTDSTYAGATNEATGRR